MNSIQSQSMKTSAFPTGFPTGEVGNISGIIYVLTHRLHNFPSRKSKWHQSSSRILKEFQPVGKADGLIFCFQNSLLISLTK